MSKNSADMIWKFIPDFLNYEVSEHGDVRRGTKYLKVHRDFEGGRKRICLSKGGRRFWFDAAHLVALAFIGPRPFKRAELCHNDGFEHNNHYSNLRWDTKIGNAADRVKHKLQRDSHSALPIPRHRVISADATMLLAANQPRR